CHVVHQPEAVRGSKRLSWPDTEALVVEKDNLLEGAAYSAAVLGVQRSGHYSFDGHVPYQLSLPFSDPGIENPVVLDFCGREYLEGLVADEVTDVLDRRIGVWWWVATCGLGAGDEV